MARAKKDTSAVLLGEISDEEFKLLDQERGIQAPAIKSLRIAHHRLAQVLASGATEMEASRICGLSPSRISILKADPTFQQLLASAMNRKDELFGDVLGQFKDMLLDGLQEIRQRLMDAPETIPTKDILDMINSFADRTGFAKTEKHLHAHVHASTDIEKLKSAAAAARRGRVEVVSSHMLAAPERGEEFEGLEGTATVLDGGEREVVREESPTVSTEELLQFDLEF